ncbi:MAG: DUF3990 domain-containing protein [Eubacterium sp.]|nr:DUF3990 domain-containing protein [Eubacterium sp.]
MKNSEILTNFLQFKENHIVSTNETVTLYHGSKSGIHGAIAPISREHCDFGKGFYMGTDRTQPLTLICNYPNAKIYTLSMNLSDLKILDIDIGIDWALLIAYHRGKMEFMKYSAFYNRLSNLNKNCDMIIGYIANDRMFVILDRFFNGEITDLALINSLSALKLGKQYVALTQKACNKIKILDKQELTETEREKLRHESQTNRSKGIAMAEEICRKYRRDGQFFDEILKAGE